MRHLLGRPRATHPRATRALALLAGSLLAGSLASCAAPGSDASTDTEPTSISTDVADQHTTLTVFTAAGVRDYQQDLADAFHEEYPAIDVELQVEADNNYNTVLPRLLASDDPPDLAAPADLTGSVRDGLLTDLDKYADAYGWEKKVPASILDGGRVQDGTIGAGPLYVAGGAAGPMTGVFYNRELARKVGMTEVPATLDDLAAVMAKAKARGTTPVVASNADGLVGHLYNLLLGEYMGPQSVLDVVWHRPDASLDTTAAEQATATLGRWAEAGYFNSDVNAINQDASYGRFASGDGLFMFQGSWMTQALPDSFDGGYGMFPMPPLEKGGPAISMTGNSLGFGIAASSDDKDAAALFLDFLSSPQAAKVAEDNGYPAVSEHSPDAEVTLDQPVSEQIDHGFAEVAADDGFYSWIQNSVPAVNTALTSQLQSLVAGRTSPEDVPGTLQAAYESGL